MFKIKNARDFLKILTYSTKKRNYHSFFPFYKIFCLIFDVYRVFHEGIENATHNTLANVDICFLV
jgi:hypothetical protein